MTSLRVYSASGADISPETDFEDGFPFPATLGSSLAWESVEAEFARSGAHVGTRPEGDNHSVRYNPYLTYPMGKAPSAWVRMAPGATRLAGIVLVNPADTSKFHTVIIDARNHPTSPSAMGFQVRGGVSATGSAGVVPSETILSETWYRIVAWITPGTVEGRLYNAAGTLIAATSRIPLTPYEDAYLGIFGYGEAWFDDYTVGEASAPLARFHAVSGDGAANDGSHLRVFHLDGAGEVRSAPKARLIRLAGAGTTRLVVDPIPGQSAIEPGSIVTVAATAGTGAPDEWTWRQISGPAVTLVGEGASRLFRAPSSMSTITITLGVRASSVDATSAEQTVAIQVLPQTRWYYHQGTWNGLPQAAWL